MRYFLLLIFSLSSLFSSIISKDVDGGNGTFLGITYIEDEQIAVVAADSGGIKALKVNDTSLDLLSTAVLTGSVKDVVKSSSGNIIYAATNSSGLYVLDYSSPSVPQIITSIPTVGQSIDLSIDHENNLLAVAEDSSGVRIFNVSSESLPSLIKTIETKKQVIKVYIKDNALVIGYLNGEVEIYDILADYEKKYTFTHFLSVNQLIEYNGNLAVLDGTSGLYIYDITKTDLPLLKGAFSLNGGIGLGFNGSNSYISTTNNLIYKLEIDTDRILFDSTSSISENINELFIIDTKIVATRFDKSVELLQEIDNTNCSEEITYGKNPLTENWSKFYSGCDVPDGWIKTTTLPIELASKEIGSYSNKDIESLGTGWHLLGTSEQINDLSIFDSSKTVWSYDNGAWSVYTSKTSLNRNIDRSLYPELESILAGNGFWVQND